MKVFYCRKKKKNSVKKSHFRSIGLEAFFFGFVWAITEVAVSSVRGELVCLAKGYVAVDLETAFVL